MAHGPGVALRRTLPLRRYYRRLLAHFGPQRWWPGDSAFEIALGALLVQNTAWRNAERALENLRRAGLLSEERLSAVPAGTLLRHLRPAGTYRQKARLVRRFLRHLRDRYRGKLALMFHLPAWHLRAELLHLPGIGPETADSILLYAGNKPVFVVDDYTRRVVRRHGLAPRGTGTDGVQRLFEGQLPADAVLYQEYHALLVAVGQQYCHRREPDCANCPLRAELPDGKGGTV